MLAQLCGMSRCDTALELIACSAETKGCTAVLFLTQCFGNIFGNVRNLLQEEGVNPCQDSIYTCGTDKNRVKA